MEQSYLAQSRRLAEDWQRLEQQQQESRASLAHREAELLQIREALEWERAQQASRVRKFTIYVFFFVFCFMFMIMIIVLVCTPPQILFQQFSTVPRFFKLPIVLILLLFCRIFENVRVEVFLCFALCP